MYRCCEKVLTGARGRCGEKLHPDEKKGGNLRTGHEGLGDQTSGSPRDASGPFGLNVSARAGVTVTVVSTASDGGEVNEGRVGDARGEGPDGWGERDGFFYYFERRGHLVGGVRGESWLAVVNSGTVRRMSITGIEAESNVRYF